MSSRCRTYRPVTKLAAANCNRCKPFKRKSSALRACVELRYLCSKQHLAYNSRNKSNGFSVLETVIQLKIPSHNLLIKTNQPILYSVIPLSTNMASLSQKEVAEAVIWSNTNLKVFFQCDVIKLMTKSAGERQIRTWEYLKIETSVASQKTSFLLCSIQEFFPHCIEKYFAT